MLPSYNPLHLKYRPQTLIGLVGQPTIQTCLTNALVSGQIAPAYLFTGSRGTGKTSSARIFAKSLNCLSRIEPTVTPCGECQSCKSIDVSGDLDVTEIDAASNGGVDDARDLVRTVGFAPIRGRYRVIIIDECHNLTKPAQDALLKCIEEPPAHIVFILCTTEAHKVLATITSRCQVYTFNAIGVQTIQAHLKQIAVAEQIAITDDGITAIARLCAGGLRDGLQLLSKAALLGQEADAAQIYELAGIASEPQLLGILEAIRRQDVLGLLQATRSLLDAGKSPKAVHATLLGIYRDLLILWNAPDQTALLSSPVTTKTLKVLVKDWTLEAIQHGLSTLHEAEQQLRFSSNEQVWLEVCLLNLVPVFKLATAAAVPPQPASAQVVKPEAAVQTLTPKQVWAIVLERTSDKNRAFLASAKLVQFDGQTATLEIPDGKDQAYRQHLGKIAQLLAKAVGRPKQVIPITIRCLAAVQ